MKARRWTGALLAVLGTAAVVRVYGLTWGLPLKFGHIDESVVLFYALRVVDGAWAPGFFDYPAFFLYLLAGAIRLAQSVGRGVGALPPISEMLEGYVAGDSVFFLIAARGLTALFALGTVALTADMGRRRGQPWTGLAAALLLAVNPLHVLHSHYGTVDVAAAFFVLWALDRTERYWSTGAVRDGVWASVAVGLGAAVKYYPAVLTPLLLAAPWARGRRNAARAAAAWGAIALAAFFLGSPETLVELPRFFSRFGHLFPKIVGAPGGAMPYVDTLRGLAQGLGVPVMIAAAAGGWIVARGPSPWRMSAAGALVIFAFVGLWRAQLPHYALGLYAPALVLATLGIERTARRHRALPWAAGALVLVLSGVSTVHVLRDLRRTDTRLTAAEWGRGRFAPGSRILRFAHTAEWTARDGFSVRTDFTNALLAGESEGVVSDEWRGYDYVVYGSYGPAEDANVKKLSAVFPLLKTFENGAPRFPHRPRVYVFDGRERAG